MSWMNELYCTYEYSSENNHGLENPLSPIAHMTAHAQIEVTLDEKGNFIRAVAVPKQKSETLIPVTEASAGRVSGMIAPHPLCDTLSYIAGDFETYCIEERDKNKAAEKFKCYMQNLEKWVQSEYLHPKIVAIYNYLAKKELALNLIEAGMIELDNGYFSDKKICGQPYEKARVRFRVLLMDSEADSACWEDKTLFQSYTKFYLSNQNGRKDICYFMGREQVISDNHPKGIVAANFGAKLISANDDRGYTYRGRFQNSEQPYALSYEASQKIHSTLTWLIKKQGAYIGKQDKRTFVCWNPKGKRAPDILDPFDFFDDSGEQDSEVIYRKKLIKTFQGYQNQFQKDDKIIIMGLDAATIGRLSITYYNEFMAETFYERLTYWGETCNWWYLNFNEQKKPFFKIQTPVFKRIVECAYGREQGKFIEADDRVMKEQVQRLLKCMLDKQALPFDIVQSLVNRASMPLAYSNGNREFLLSTACAMIVKYYYDKKIIKKGESDLMKLDTENRNRSYLFGRLLAVLEKVERSTYERDEKREPNAIRLQSAYVNHPIQTWKILEDALNPYFQKLSFGSREYYRRLISEITMLFAEEDEKIMNQGLKENYLLGYYLQRAELNKKKETLEEEK